MPDSLFAVEISRNPKFSWLLHRGELVVTALKISDMQSSMHSSCFTFSVTLPYAPFMAAWMLSAPCSPIKVTV